MKSSKLVDFVNYFFLLVFLLCIAVQYNDPDPLQWMAIYGAALSCCILFALRKLPSYLPAAVGLTAFVWAFLILPDVWGQKIPGKEIFATMHMLSPGVEEVREIGGLLIVSLWMLMLFLKSKKGGGGK